MLGFISPRSLCLQLPNPFSGFGSQLKLVENKMEAQGNQAKQGDFRWDQADLGPEGAD